MIPFPRSFVELIVIGSLILTSVGVLGLLTLLARDFKAGKLW